jgi:hypothetical protein
LLMPSPISTTTCPVLRLYPDFVHGNPFSTQARKPCATRKTIRPGAPTAPELSRPVCSSIFASPRGQSCTPKRCTSCSCYSQAHDFKSSILHLRQSEQASYMAASYLRTRIGQRGGSASPRTIKFKSTDCSSGDVLRGPFLRLYFPALETLSLSNRNRSLRRADPRRVADDDSDLMPQLPRLESTSRDPRMPHLAHLLLSGLAISSEQTSLKLGYTPCL